ncbi:MAG: septation protein SpoVG family protein [Planctomycetota bacterium]
MEITEVRIRLVQEEGKEKLRAFASITFDRCFVVREVKVIEGENGFFVAMPSRKAMFRCRECGARNVRQSSFCNGCGRRLPSMSASDPRSREKLYMDLAHPVNAACRRWIHEAVLKAYLEQVERARTSEEAVRLHAEEEPPVPAAEPLSPGPAGAPQAVPAAVDSEDPAPLSGEEVTPPPAETPDGTKTESGFDQGIFD